MQFKVLPSIDLLDKVAYQKFCDACNAPLFYDLRILIAAEKTPVLAVDKAFYIIAYKGEKIRGFLPCYLQPAKQVDPFGLLQKTANVNFTENGKGLFGHIMHCYDTTILVDEKDSELYDAMLAQMEILAVSLGVEYFGLINVSDKLLMSTARENNYSVNFMLDRYFMDVDLTCDLDQFVSRLPADGRREMNRQLRKFSGSNDVIIIEKKPLNDLRSIITLVQQTTAKHGTPHYFPQEALFNFIRNCEELVCLVKIKKDDVVIGSFICFEKCQTFHIWAAGMSYEQVDFSPYTVLFSEAYKYILKKGFSRLEAGRLNARIKERLGLKPFPLYSVIGKVK